jgi:hypothetical protein
VSAKIPDTLYEKSFDYLQLLLSCFGTDLLTGERCGRKELFEKGYTLGKTGYCIEILFNEFILSNKISFLIVPINAYAIPKAIKMGLIKGNIANLKMCFEIMKAARPWTFLKQSVLMPYYSRRYRKAYNKNGGKL